MSADEIIGALPRLTHEERRRIARLIFEMEEDARTLADADQRAADNFRLLDRMEADDAELRAR
jgi:hypothetical protein